MHGWSPAPLDVARVLDAVYAFEVREHAAWLERLQEALAPSFAGSRNILLALHRTMATGGRNFLATAPRFPAILLAAAASAEFRRVWDVTPPVSFTAPTMRRGDLGALPVLLEHGVIDAIPKDTFHVWSADSDGVCLSIAACLSEEGAPLAPATRARWTQLTAHLGAAARLRVRGLPQPDAVLAPDGTILDARGDAQSKESRAALQMAARAVDRVRGRRITDAEEALAVWRVLTDGRWTIADEHDTDGRRFVVAYENVPMPRHVTEPRLSLRERQVACFAALGHTNKHIGYSLELSPSTVATHLKHACLKLGAATRAELALRLLEGPAALAAE